MKAKQAKITPTIALRLLEANKQNRRVRPANVEYWSNCLRNGQVELTPQGIALEGTLSKPTRLLDGQHRLLAVAGTGITLESFVFEGCDPSIFKFIDCGQRRTIGDLTGMDRHTEQMVRLLARIYCRSRKLNSVEAENIAEALGDHCVKGSDRPIITTVAIKLAFALHYAKTGEDHYEAWRSSDFANMTPSLQNLYAYLHNNPVEQGMEDGKYFTMLKTASALCGDTSPCSRKNLYGRAREHVKESSDKLHAVLSNL